jgi:hypothetical protein
MHSLKESRELAATPVFREISVKERRIQLFKGLDQATHVKVQQEMWKELIKIENMTGGGLSKACSHLYLKWFKAARLRGGWNTVFQW